MKTRLRFKHRLNNKGNTLGIVIIGIFILSILGTLILGLTATNFNMKLVDKKSESTFYYAEKAIDEVYAGIGTEVMACAREAYENVMENFVRPDSGSINGVSYLKNDEANELFKDTYINGKSIGPTVLIQGLKQLFPEGTTDVNTILSRLQTYIIPEGTYDINLAVYDDGTDETEVVYETDASGEVTSVSLKNVCVECETKNTGFYASILTDFKIKVPDMSIGFSASGGTHKFDEFFSYSLVAQGTNSDAGAIDIDAVSTTITGNIYAGNSNNKESLVLRRPNANLRINAKNLVCEGSFILKSANAVLRNLNGEEALDSIDTLQFYAGGIKTENSATGGVSNASNLDIAGDCIISDDLEINGDNSTLNIKGNYFGYGFMAKADVDDPSTPEDETKVEADRGTTVISGFNRPSTDTPKEHEKRSAIIINAKSADVNMMGLSKLILAGRAYIDLDEGGQYGDASYMTGESISFKGNQQMYLADNLGEAVSGNPVSYEQEFLGKMTSLGWVLGTEPDISLLGLDSNKIVAKKTGSKVYFYYNQKNPVEQTEYFIDTFNNDNNMQRALSEQISKLDVKNLKFSTGLKAYTSGVFMQVENNEIVVPRDNGKLKYGDQGISEDDFHKIIADIKIRKSHLTPSLHDLSTTSILGRLEYTTEALSTETGTPYEYYMNETFVNLQTGRLEKTDLRGQAYSEELKNVLQSIDSNIDFEHATYNGKHFQVGYLITNEGGTGSFPITFDAGVVVTNRPITINKDFMGLIVCNGSVYISGGNVEIKACKELVEWMFFNIPDLQKCLKGFEPTDPDAGDLYVESGGITYKDLVEKSNWRRNTK